MHVWWLMHWSLLCEKNWSKISATENLLLIDKYLKELVCHFVSFASFTLSLVDFFCMYEMILHTTCGFCVLELAKLDKTERRYAWIKRRLRTNEEIWKIFPSSWHVPYLLCIQFCKLTRFVICPHFDLLKLRTRNIQ